MTQKAQKTPVAKSHSLVHRAVQRSGTGTERGCRIRVHAMRKDALARFAEPGFPTTRNEEWRFTNVTPLARLNFTLPDGRVPVSADAIDPFLLPGTTCGWCS